jgi:hypothetical protein
MANECRQTAVGTAAGNDVMTLASVVAGAVITASGLMLFHLVRRVHRVEAIEGEETIGVEEDRVAGEDQVAKTENRTVAPTTPGERCRTD